MALPILHSAPHVATDDGMVEVWFLKPAAVFLRLGKGAFAAPSARFVTEQVWPTARALSPAPAKIAMVWDCALMSQALPDAREVMMSWHIANRHHLGRVCLVMPDSATAFARMGLSVAALALRTAGAHLEVVNDLEVTCAELKLAPDGRVAELLRRGAAQGPTTSLGTLPP